MSSPALSATAKKNVETICYKGVEQQLAGSNEPEWTASGTPSLASSGHSRFIVAHALFIAGWFVLNLRLLSGVQPFAPYPFPFLGLIVGIEFIFLTTFVLMNQNLYSRREEQWAHLNLQLAMLAEHGVTKNMQMLYRICKHLGARGTDRVDTHRELKEQAQTTPVTTLVEEIAEKLGETKTRLPSRWCLM